MDILVPMDGSECSLRALNTAIEIATACTGTLDVVHFTDVHTDATDELLEVIETTLEDTPIQSSVDVVTDVRVSEPRSSTHIGRRIVELVEEQQYDHVIMGHHGTGVVGELILGSTAKTVIEDSEVPVTTVP